MNDFQPVHFADDSASPMECAAGLTRLAISNKLVEAVRNDPAAAQMNVARIVNWAVERLNGPTVWGDCTTDEAETILALCAAMEIPIPVGGPLSAALIQLLIAQVLKALQDMLSDAVQ